MLTIKLTELLEKQYGAAVKIHSIRVVTSDKVGVTLTTSTYVRLGASPKIESSTSKEEGPVLRHVRRFVAATN